MTSYPKPPPREKKSRKRIQPRRWKSLQKECDTLWDHIILLRAGLRSEISGRSAWIDNGKVEGVHPHHLLKKNQGAFPHLRHEPINGICITASEHSYGAHSDNLERCYEFKTKVKALRGDGIYLALEDLEIKRNIEKKRVNSFIWHTEIKDLLTRKLREVIAEALNMRDRKEIVEAYITKYKLQP